MLSLLEGNKSTTSTSRTKPQILFRNSSTSSPLRSGVVVSAVIAVLPLRIITHLTLVIVLSSKDSRASEPVSVHNLNLVS